MRLEAAFRQDGESWIAWCPPLDVLTQAESKPAALAALKEAVELWFESCIERGVLEEALSEVGFKPVKPGEHIPEDASSVEFSKRSPVSDAFTLSESFEVTIPAYIAA